MKKLFLLLILLLIPTASAFDVAEIQKLGTQYSLSQAIPVFSGYLQKGWHDYGSITIPSDWSRVYLVIVPYAESGHRVTVKINGYDVILDRPLSSTITADVTQYVNPGEPARVNIWCSGTPRVAIFFAPPNDASPQNDPTSNTIEFHEQQLSLISNVNDTITWIKYGLLGIGLMMLIILAVVLLHKR